MSQAGESIIIVSGLPRSGTSLMMQMLAAGGVQVVRDNHRIADANNPRGYLEDKRVRRLHLDTSWLGEAEGKALKVVSPLLHLLPDQYRYRILFMERPLPEILQSQRTMLHRIGHPDDTLDLGDKYRLHLKKLLPWIEEQPNMELLRISYPELVERTKPVLDEVDRFLAFPLDLVAMKESVRKELYRSRGKTSRT